MAPVRKTLLLGSATWTAFDVVPSCQTKACYWCRFPLAWWSIHEEVASDWTAFKVLFKAKYCDQKDEMAYWEDIQGVKQGPGVSIEEVSSRLRHLFTLVKVSSPSLMIRTFLLAIKPDIAMEVEKEGDLDTFDDVVKRATTIDKVNRRYGLGDGSTTSSRYYTTINKAGTDRSYEDFVAQVKALADEVSNLKLKNAPEAKSKPPFACYNCGDPGHSSKQCTLPKVRVLVSKTKKSPLINVVTTLADDARGGPPSGDGGGDVRGARGCAFGGHEADILCDDDRGDGCPRRVSPNESVMVNAFASQKRPASDIINMEAAAGRTNKKNISPGVGPSATTTTKNKREPPRKLPVHVPTYNIWDHLKATQSPLTLADWLRLDKTAYKDLRDGLRYLHGRSSVSKAVNAISTTIGNLDGLGGVGDVGRTYGVSATDSVGGTNNIGFGDTDLDSPQSDVGAVNGSTDLDGVDILNDDLYSDTDSWAISSDDGDDDALSEGGFSDDTEYPYPYSFDYMKNSKPFSAPVVIGSTLVNAIFDAGASVSVIGSDLANELGLVPNGDSLTLTSFDNKTRHSCPITADSQKNLCLLGMTWFSTYGVKQDLKEHVLIIPTNNGTRSVELYGDNPGDVAAELMVTSNVFLVNVRADQDLDGYDQVVLCRKGYRGKCCA
ncbi:hypothetical protein BCR42DRAFT_468641 [Absidia repens]|uniref:CCHC-type domain-containing protein n=1 Tax=Absidia repens TaxID=90262 RepID=A0A1X2IYI4_9FUNG|nr:hypothetical protein BCR42DRAFT_468641 [Absidia repens]